MKANLSTVPPTPSLFSMTTSAPSTAWYPDTGATHHVTSDLSSLSVSNDYKGMEKLIIENGDTLQIAHIGHGILPTLTKSLVLKNVLHVPSITSFKSYPATSVFDPIDINVFVDLSSQQPTSTESSSSSTPKHTHPMQLRASTLTRKPTAHLVTSTNVETPFEPTSYAQAHK